jgi:hypothetical protein
MNTSSTSWPLFLGKALYDVRGHIEDSTETMMAAFEQFARRWGGFDAEAFQRALLGGNDNDRLFALFALGYSTSLPMLEVVMPFLKSSLVKERWASIITLGRWKQEEVLPSLITLLQEGLIFTPPVNLSFLGENESVHGDLEDARYQQEYEWYRLQRQHVAMVLASWQHPQVIPALIQAFDFCYRLEISSPALKTYSYLGHDWHTFQDCLAYALGQQQAWNVSESLALPPERLHILRMFMVYGSLHAKVSRVLGGMWYLSYEEMGISKPEHVDNILQKHFHLSPEECVTFYRDFMQYCAKRENLHSL